MELKKGFLQELNKDFSSCRANLIAQRAVGNAGLLEASVNRFGDETNRHSFNINLKETEVYNQKQSGRCWMFASLNVMEYHLCKNHNLKSFELSQNYSLFYDKFERCNYFLESIVKTFNEDIHSRIVSHLLKDPIGDGGQWDMFKNIVQKYGVVPKYSMPETFNSSATNAMNFYLTKMLRMFAKDLRNAHEQGKNSDEINAMIKEMMKKVHRALCITLGTPPQKIDFETRDKDDKLISFKNLTPQEFFKNHVKMQLDDYVSLINAPTKDKPYYKNYTVKFLGNVTEGNKINYINVPIEVMKEATVKQLKDNEPVWFGCDVGQFFYRKGSRLDLTTVKVDDLWNVKYDFNKEERLDFGESLMTHAMVFMGCEYDEESKLTKRFRVENSWGKDVGHNGFWVMSNAWYDEYMYQVLINKKNLPKKVLESLNEKVIELEAWDPMGSLAKISF